MSRRKVSHLTFAVACECGGVLEMVNEGAVTLSARGVGTQALTMLGCPRHGDFIVQVKFIPHKNTLSQNQVRKDRAERLRVAS